MARNNRKIFLLQAPAPNPALQPGNILLSFIQFLSLSLLSSTPLTFFNVVTRFLLPVTNRLSFHCWNIFLKLSFGTY